MPAKHKEIFEELKSVVTGKTLDALLPPLVFVIVNGLAGLDQAIVFALGLAVLLSLIRLLRKQTWHYALGGLFGVALASGFAYLTRSATSYFIPAIISSALLLLLALVSLLAGKPLAAWASHLTRGWPLSWFWREDIKPAYREVTWFWAAFFLMRLLFQVALFQSGDATRLAWANTILGWPVTIIILVITYLYGIWRLRRLGGPGVEEYQSGKEPPWQGQIRGF
jgi:hypothetical protein